MSPRISKEEGSEYKRRWRIANEAEIAELGSMTPEQKFRQLCALFDSVESAGWTEELASENAHGRERWLKLREVYRDRD